MAEWPPATKDKRSLKFLKIPKIMHFWNDHKLHRVFRTQTQKTATSAPMGYPTVIILAVNHSGFNE